VTLQGSGTVVYNALSGVDVLTPDVVITDMRPAPLSKESGDLYATRQHGTPGMRAHGVAATTMTPEELEAKISAGSDIDTATAMWLYEELTRPAKAKIRADIPVPAEDCRKFEK
jgi:hypothetical protein